MRDTRAAIKIPCWIIVSIFVLACTNTNDYSKTNHLYTEKIEENLFAEHFNVDSYGVGGDVYSFYLTDSSKFRKFVSLYYDSETFDFKINEGVIELKKLEEVGGLNGVERSKKLLKKYVYIKRELQSEGSFD